MPYRIVDHLYEGHNVRRATHRTAHCARATTTLILSPTLHWRAPLITPHADRAPPISVSPRVSGAPVARAHAPSQARSFIHDPMRFEDAERYQREFQPSEEHIRAIHDVLEGNPYWSQMKSWAADPTVPSARLVLRWPGTTPVEARAAVREGVAAGLQGRVHACVRVHPSMPCP